MKQTKKRKKILGCIILIAFSIVALLFTLLFLKINSLIGHHDGPFTERDQVHQIVFPIYIVISFLFACYFAYLGYQTIKRDVKKQVRISLILFAVFINLVFFMNYILKSFSHNVGG